MLALFRAAVLVISLVLLAPGPLSAQAPIRLVEAGDGHLTVELTCSGRVSGPLSVVLDDRPPVPATVLAGAAQALVLVVDVSPAMGAAGTPHSTRLADAALGARMLLERAPAGTPVAVVSFDRVARTVLPPTVDRAAALAAVAALAIPPTEEPAGPYALAEGLRLGAALLAATPTREQALVAFAAGVPGLVFDTAALRAELGPTLSVAIVGLGADATGASADGGSLVAIASNLGAAYIPFHTTDLHDLPALAAELERRVAALLTPEGPLRLRAKIGELTRGPHRLTVSGCGAPATLDFAVPGVALPSAMGTVLAVGFVAALGLAWWRARRPGAAMVARSETARRKQAVDVTTARRASGQHPGQDLRVIVWDGARRGVYPLARRQSLVGRDPACEISIDSEWVSGLHARLTRVGDQLEITDLESTNGTFIGEEARPLRPGVPEPLAPGVPVLLGRTVRLELRSGGE